MLLSSRALRLSAALNFVLLLGVGYGVLKVAPNRKRELAEARAPQFVQQLTILGPSRGDETSPETMQAAANFAQAIRKMPIRCGEVPGFVGNRIAISAIGEVWRAQEEEGLTTEEVDKLVQESGALPMGPFFLADMLGLDTAVHTAEYLRQSYGDRFYVHKGMQELVAAGNLGAKTGKGFYEHGS